MPETAYVLRHQEAGVVTLSLNRAEKFNPLSSEMMSALQTEFNSIAHDESVRVVVVAALGKAFCAGHDLKQMRAEPSMDYYTALFKQCSKLMLSIAQLPQPVIARVHGMATAAGCQLVAACDLAVAVDAAQFAVSGINYGLFCSTPAVALSRNVGRKAALEMLLTGEFISAQQVLEKGLLNYVVTAENLDAKIAELCASICAKPRSVVALGKALFYKQLEMGTEAAYQLAGHTIAENMMREEALEGVQAFIQKRQPSWKKII